MKSYGHWTVCLQVTRGPEPLIGNPPHSIRMRPAILPGRSSIIHVCSGLSVARQKDARIISVPTGTLVRGTSIPSHKDVYHRSKRSACSGRYQYLEKCEAEIACPTFADTERLESDWANGGAVRPPVVNGKVDFIQRSMNPIPESARSFWLIVRTCGSGAGQPECYTLTQILAQQPQIC
jgi:hypothetical protein